MKKYLVVLFSLSLVCAEGQKSLPKKTGLQKAPSHENFSLKNLNDSVSYAIGLSVANFYHQQGIKNLNTALVSKAINDVMANKKALLTEAQAQDAVMHYLNPGLSKNIEAGERFLAENKKKPGVITTATGLQYEILTPGSGAKPGPSDTVVAHYKGNLLDGKEIDNSYKRGEPLTIPVNRVIPGWTEALQLMPTGSKFKFYIPYKLAYGPNDNGQIPGGSMLEFEIELLSIKGR